MTATEWFFQGHFPGLPVMPGVLQVEALAQTMAVYVAKQPGFGDRIGLFAGIDETRFKRIVVPGDVLRLEVTMDKLGWRFGRGRGVASVDGEVACEARSASSSRPKASCDADRRAWRDEHSIAVLSDVHGNATALEAVRKALKKEKPDVVIVAGDLVMNGPEPGARSTRSGRWSATARSIVQGNTDVAVADFDYAAAFPWFTDRRPRRPPRRRGVGPRRARRRPARLAAPPARRAARPDRRRPGARLTHASPGSQTQGFDARPRPVDGPRADLPHRRPGHLLRPHPPPGRPASSAGR